MEEIWPQARQHNVGQQQCLAPRALLVLSQQSALPCRLRDVLWDHTQLYLIMDYVEQDLRQFMDNDPQSRSLSTVKVKPPSPLAKAFRQAGLLLY